jgi:SRSO17 transposase
LRDLVRVEVLATLGDAGGVLVVDETGFLKKGAHSAGVARQYTPAETGISTTSADATL